MDLLLEFIFSFLITTLLSLILYLFFRFLIGIRLLLNYSISSINYDLYILIKKNFKFVYSKNFWKKCDNYFNELYGGI